MTLGTVMIVPGIGGCTLSSPPVLFGLGPPLQVWLDTTTLILGGWRLLGLGPDGVTPSVPLTGAFTPGPPLPPYYGTLEQELTRLGWRVVGARLDWRQTIARDGERLVSQIEAVAGDGPVRLLCHSRGGLVAREAFRLMLLSGQLGLVGRCAGLGVPHQGSWEAAGLLAGWSQSAALLTLLLENAARLLPGGSVLGRLREVIISWPGAYELLPQPGAEGIDPDQVDTIYDPSTWSSISRSVSADWLAAAHQRWLTAIAVPSTVEWIDVLGTGFETADQLIAPELLATTHALSWNQGGDSTVPTRWATQPGRKRITAPTSHGALIYDGRVIAALHDYLVHGLDADVVIGGALLQ